MNASQSAPFSAAHLQSAALAAPHAILDPILRAGSLAVIYGPPGVGKSLLALGMACTAAGGGTVLGWRARRPHKVLFLDSDLRATEMQRRLALFGPAPPSLRLWLTGESRGPGLDLATVDGWERLMSRWESPELLVVDLAGTDSEGWTVLRRFLAMARRAGRAVLLVDTANRQGAMRGTTRREDMLDLVMALRRPADWCASDGARFELHFGKANALHGPGLQPMLVHLRTAPGAAATWHCESLPSTLLDRAVVLLRQGVKAEAAAAALGISPAWAYRLQRRARDLGRLAPATKRRMEG
jgi:hypothetical protein